MILGRSPIPLDISSVFIGVHWNKLEKKWVAALRKNGKIVFVRGYDSFDDAIVARLLAESAYFGEFAPQKHLFQKYGIKGVE